MSWDLFGGEQPRTGHDVTASGAIRLPMAQSKTGKLYLQLMQETQTPLLTRPRGLTVRPSSYKSNIPTDVGTHDSPTALGCTWFTSWHFTTTLSADPPTRRSHPTEKRRCRQATRLPI